MGETRSRHSRGRDRFDLPQLLWVDPRSGHIECGDSVPGRLQRHHELVPAPGPMAGAVVEKEMLSLSLLSSI
ncbi:hypothetical protein H6P81_020920 [Aristolochia fimbriata]|uniref:Uncharacterized protein n=1 Tax=Aristolochia fimbriata TaxID=158543 RepID=A0AAV7DXJ7_ARIFI|nr:hypothetical protein H6P81_020920 [Aristolochia fimbriata]